MIHVIQAIAITLIVLSILVKAIAEPKALPVPTIGAQIFSFISSVLILIALLAGW